MTGVAVRYEQRRTELLARIAGEERRLGRIGMLRLLVFGAAVASWWYALRPQTLDWRWGSVAIALTAAFAVAVHQSRRSRARLARARDLHALTTEALARLARDWDALPLREWDAPDATHPYAADLDLFGRGSLSQLVPPLSRAPGRATLGSWLLAPAEVPVIAQRQEAIRDLIDRHVLRDELATQGMYVTIPTDRLEALATWAREGLATPWRGLMMTAMTMSLITIALIAGQASGAIDRPFWLLSTTVALLVSGRHARALHRAYARADGHLTTLRAYGTMIDHVERETFHAAVLVAAQRDLTTGAHGARAAIRRLADLVQCAEVTRSPLPHMVLNALLLWDVQVLAGFRWWQATRGGEIDRWLAAIGTVEALAALATLAYEHPDWSFPEVTADPTSPLSARALGHPLLPPASCVRNDVEVGPRGTLLVISGSNMSGKSTLLRAIGVNTVLAQAGSVVCAAAMRCPPLAVHTSMRIEDSLPRGVSHFMAELLRIKSIVDAANSASDDRPVLYLLDEVLHGTNSVERVIATERIIRHLMAVGAVGVVTTHDLALFDAPSMADAVRHAHFGEHFEASGSGRVMRFDYVLRPGKATSRNALALLEMVGLPADGPPPEAHDRHDRTAS